MAIKLAKVPTLGHKYIPLSERGEENPFTVWVKPMSSKTLMTLEDAVVIRKNSEEVFLAAGVFAFKTCQVSIMSWANIEDAEGKPLELKKEIGGVASEESIGCIPSDFITEISNVVATISRDPGQIQVLFDNEDEIASAPVVAKKVKPTE